MSNVQANVQANVWLDWAVVNQLARLADALDLTLDEAARHVLTVYATRPEAADGDGDKTQGDQVSDDLLTCSICGEPADRLVDYHTEGLAARCAACVTDNGCGSPVYGLRQPAVLLVLNYPDEKTK